MAIREYKPGEHSAGFVGLRVCVEVAGPGKHRVRMFNFKKMTRDEAQAAAEAAEAEFKAEAEAIRQSQLAVPKKNARAGVIIRGLSAYLIVRKLRTGTRSINAGFVVRNRGHGAGQQRFGVREHGFDESYRQAAQTWLEWYPEAPETMETLMQRKPSASVFTNDLRLQANKGRRGNHRGSGVCCAPGISLRARRSQPQQSHTQTSLGPTGKLGTDSSRLLRRSRGRSLVS